MSDTEDKPKKRQMSPEAREKMLSNLKILNQKLHPSAMRKLKHGLMKTFRGLGQTRK